MLGPVADRYHGKAAGSPVDGFKTRIDRLILRPSDFSSSSLASSGGGSSVRKSTRSRSAWPLVRIQPFAPVGPLRLGYLTERQPPSAPPCPTDFLISRSEDSLLALRPLRGSLVASGDGSSVSRAPNPSPASSPARGPLDDGYRLLSGRSQVQVLPVTPIGPLRVGSLAQNPRRAFFCPIDRSYRFHRFGDGSSISRAPNPSFISLPGNGPTSDGYRPWSRRCRCETCPSPRSGRCVSVIRITSPTRASSPDCSLPLVSESWRRDEA